MTHWYEGPLASFDTETTGVDVEQDRIVTAALVTQSSAGGPLLRRDWAADPGVPIPAGATAVHGLTDAWVAGHGRPARVVLPWVTCQSIPLSGKGEARAQPAAAATACR